MRLRLRRWRSDYGRGPLRWYVVTTTTSPPAFWRSCTLGEVMRQPGRAWRWLAGGSGER